jgi:hypothetical protein
MTTWLPLFTIAGSALAWIGCGYVWWNFYRTRRWHRQSKATFETLSKIAHEVRDHAEHILAMRQALVFIATYPRSIANLPAHELQAIIGQMQICAAQALASETAKSASGAAGKALSVMLN